MTTTYVNDSHITSFTADPTGTWEVRFTTADERWSWPVLGWAVMQQTLRDGSIDTHLQPVLLVEGAPWTLDDYVSCDDLQQVRREIVRTA